MSILGLRVVGPTVAAALVASTSAWWLTPALCHTSRPQTTATYTAERGNHVAKFQSVDRKSESGREGEGKAKRTLRRHLGTNALSACPLLPTHPPPPPNATLDGGGRCVDCERGENRWRQRMEAAATAGGKLVSGDATHLATRLFRSTPLSHSLIFSPPQPSSTRSPRSSTTEATLPSSSLVYSFSFDGGAFFARGV